MRKLPVAGPEYDYKLENIRNSILEEELALTHRKLENIELGAGDLIFTDDSGNQKTVRTLQTAVDDPSTGLAATATAVSTLSTNVTTLDGTVTALSSSVTTLQSELNTAETNITANATATSNLDTRVTSAEGTITSQATSITSLTTSVGSNTTSISTNASSINGIEGKYAVKINNNNHVSGFGLISTANNATPTSVFTVTADAFKIVDTSGAATPTAPFEVYTSSRTVDGVSVPAGVYMDNAFITSASIKTLDADVITAGTINADRLSVDGTTIDTSGGNLIVKTGGVDTAQVASSAISALNTSYTASGTVSYATGAGSTIASVSASGVSGDKFLGIITVGWYSNSTSSVTSINQHAFVGGQGMSLLFHASKPTSLYHGGSTLTGIFTATSTGTVSLTYQPSQNNDSGASVTANQIRMTLIRLKR